MENAPERGPVQRPPETTCKILDCLGFLRPPANSSMGFSLITASVPWDSMATREAIAFAFKEHKVMKKRLAFLLLFVVSVSRCSVEICDRGDRPCGVLAVDNGVHPVAKIILIRVFILAAGMGLWALVERTSN